MVLTLHLVLDPLGVSFYNFILLCVWKSICLRTVTFFFPASLVEKTVLSPLNRLRILVKNNFYYIYVFISELSILFLWSTYLFIC